VCVWFFWTQKQVVKLVFAVFNHILKSSSLTFFYTQSAGIPYSAMLVFCSKCC